MKQMKGAVYCTHSSDMRDGRAPYEAGSHGRWCRWSVDGTGRIGGCIGTSGMVWDEGAMLGRAAIFGRYGTPITSATQKLIPGWPSWESARHCSSMDDESGTWGSHSPVLPVLQYCDDDVFRMELWKFRRRLGCDR